jgi:hypothetical protein
MKLASHMSVVRLARHQDISAMLSRGDICPSRPLSSLCERTPALRASATIAVNDGTGGWESKRACESSCCSCVAIWARSPCQQPFLSSPIAITSFYGLQETHTDRTDTNRIHTDRSITVSKGIPKVKESTSTEPSTVSTSQPPTSNKEESNTSLDTNNAPFNAAFLAFCLSTANEKQKTSSKSVDLGEKKLTKSQSRRQWEWTLAIAYATGARLPAEPSTSACQDERQTWSKAKARRERGKRLAIAHATGVAGSGSGSVQ